MSQNTLFGGQEREELKKGARSIYLECPWQRGFGGKSVYLSSVRYYLQRYSKNKEASLAPIPDPQRPNLQLFRPNKDSTRPLPRPLRRPGPASSRCLPRTSRSKRNPNRGLAPSTRSPARPALDLPTHPEDPLAPPGGGGGGGGSRVRENPTKWRRPLEPRRDRALSRAPAHARASARCLLPLPLAGAGRPIPRPHTNDCPRLGSQPPRRGGGASW